MTDHQAPLFREETPPPLTGEQARLKREIYERMNPRRRKYIDRIGYERWDPFQPPNDPLDLRTDVSQRTAQELIRAFVRSRAGRSMDCDYQKGVMECALGVINRDGKYQGIFDFCLWYHELLKKEGHLA